MFKMSNQIENIVNAYKTLTKIPSVVNGKISKNGRKITAKWSVRNLDKGKATKYNTSYLLDDKLNVVDQSEFGTDVSNELLSTTSPSERFRAIIREEKDSKDAKKQYLEVWSTKGLQHSIDLTALDIHGDVYADSEFGSLEWSKDENSLVYVAEKKPVKSEPYIKRKPIKPDNGGGETPPKQGEEHVYKQDWGEQLVGKQQSVLVLWDVPSETPRLVDGMPPGWCPGQVRFSPNGDIWGVAWETEPRRLGLIFCTNRPSYIFRVKRGDLQTSKISSAGRAVRSPRVCGNSVVWLERAVGGPHHSAHAIMKYDMETEQVTEVIAESASGETDDKQSFNGLFLQALPVNCADSNRIVFSSSRRNDVRAYVVDIVTKTIKDISLKTQPPVSTSVLDVKDGVVLAVCSNMNIPGQLYVARLPPSGQEATISWHRVSEPIDVPTQVAEATTTYMEHQHLNSSDSVTKFTSLFFAPKVSGDKKLPLIVWPHGGPHANYVNSYSLEAAFFAMLGFSSLLINYRGSTGQGQESVHFLPNRVGDADVKDCKLATDDALKSHPVDGTKLCLFGGSHGGFLVTHLSGQYPEVYRAVVTRNPVIDVASMFNTTDIPDWCAVEAGFKFTEEGPVSDEELLAMRRCSPLAHVHKVKAPTALMLGSVDKRVPYYQGLEYYRRLKANGVKAKLYMYEDNHSLATPVAEMDNLINSAAWFIENIQ